MNKHRSLYNIISDSRVNDDTIINFLNVTTVKKYKQDSFGNTLLMSSIFEKRQKLALHMIDHFSEFCYPEIKNNFDNTALLCAMMSDNTKIIKKLVIKFGLRCEPNSASDDCDPLFFWSCKNNKIKIANLCLLYFSGNIDWNYEDSSKRMVLYYIIQNGHINLINRLKSKNDFAEIVKSNLQSYLLQENIDGFIKTVRSVDFFDFNLDIIHTIYITLKNEDELKKFSQTVCQYIIETKNMTYMKNIIQKLGSYSVEILDFANEFSMREQIIDLYDPKIHVFEDLEFIVNQTYHALDCENIELIVHKMFAKGINLNKMILKNYVVDMFYTYNNKALIDYYFESCDVLYFKNYFEDFENVREFENIEVLTDKVIKYKGIINQNEQIKYILFENIKNMCSDQNIDHIYIICENFPDFINTEDVLFLKKINNENFMKKLSNIYTHLTDKFMLELAFELKFNELALLIFKKCGIDSELIGLYLDDVLKLNNNNELISFILSHNDKMNLDATVIKCIENIKKNFNLRIYKLLNDLGVYREELYEILEHNLKKTHNDYCIICCNDNSQTHILFDCYHVLNIDHECIKKLKKCPICRADIFNYMQVYLV